MKKIKKILRNFKLDIILWLANGESLVLNSPMIITKVTVKDCSFINSPITIKRIEDFPINLSNNYITGGEFGIKIESIEEE